jgi:hypothetical protein
VIVRVKTQARGRYVIEKCAEKGWQCIVGIKPGESEDISDLERLLHPTEQAKSAKVGRNQACPCGSGKKYKHCCLVTEPRDVVENGGAERDRREPGSRGFFRRCLSLICKVLPEGQPRDPRVRDERWQGSRRMEIHDSFAVSAGDCDTRPGRAAEQDSHPARLTCRAEAGRECGDLGGTAASGYAKR